MNIEAGEQPGLWVEAGRLRVVLPRPFLPLAGQGDLLADALRLLTTLRRYQEEGKRAVQGVEPDAVATVGSTDGAELDRLVAGLLLLQDWQAHGVVIVPARTLTEHKPGRIHWPITARRGPPTDDPGGLVFPRLHMTRVEPRWDHPIQLLHQHTIRQIQRSFHLPITATEVQLPEAPRRLLLRWRAHCFTDRQRHVAALLARYYTATQADHDHALQGGLRANRFAPVWERMTLVALKGTRPPAYAQPYVLPDQRTVAGLSLRPDFLLQSGPDVVIADAKDYPVGDLPPSADLTKQMLYRLLRIGCADTPLPQIKNAFLLPDLVADGARLLARLPALHLSCLAVDLRRVQDAYLSGHEDPALRRAVLGLTNPD